jgi:hypothetical protein
LAGDPARGKLSHHRFVDILGRMLQAGTITWEMHDAARDFQATFTIARFDVLHCMPVLRLPGSIGRRELTKTQVDARRRVGSALEALSGLGNPDVKCARHVVGLLDRSASGRVGGAGAAGRCVSSRRRAFWWRRWGCWRVSMGTGERDRLIGEKRGRPAFSETLYPMCDECRPFRLGSGF